RRDVVVAVVGELVAILQDGRNRRRVAVHHPTGNEEGRRDLLAPQQRQQPRQAALRPILAAGERHRTPGIRRVTRQDRRFGVQVEGEQDRKSDSGQRRCSFPSAPADDAPGIVPMRRIARLAMPSPDAPTWLIPLQLCGMLAATLLRVMPPMIPAVPVAPASHLTGRFPLLAPLADRNFAVFWAGRTISLSGDQFQTVALA